MGPSFFLSAPLESQYHSPMMPKGMVDAFADELVKIAVSAEQLPVQSLPSQLVTTSLTDPLNSWDKTPDWKTDAPKGKGPEKAPQNSLPARTANKLFFQGDAVPEKSQNTKFKTLSNDNSAARQMNRDGSPIDAQSTANVASANMISPAYGPGGV